jgi:hypothetical protein
MSSGIRGNRSESTKIEYADSMKFGTSTIPTRTGDISVAVAVRSWEKSDCIQLKWFSAPRFPQCRQRPSAQGIDRGRWRLSLRQPRTVIYFAVGIANSAPFGVLSGQRCMMDFCRV